VRIEPSSDWTDEELGAADLRTSLHGDAGCRCEAKVGDGSHKCFVMDASVSVHTAETAEMDEVRASRWALARRLLRHGESSSPWRGRADCCWSLP